jgi:hypothetical protein
MMIKKRRKKGGTKMTETKGKSDTFYGWWIVFGCFFIYGFGALINYTFTIYAPFILKEMRLPFSCLL